MGKYENKAARTFKKALDETYKEALRNIELYGADSVDWINDKYIVDAYNRVYYAGSVYELNKTLLSIVKDGSVYPVDIWKEHMNNYVRETVGNNIKEVVGTSKKIYVDLVKKVTADVANEGLGIEAASREIRKRVEKELGTSINRYRSIRIARTEMNAAANYGRHQGMQAALQQGAEFKRKWISRDDSETRPCHMTEAVAEVEGNEPFIVCGEPLMHPGDPSGSAENIINCRCKEIAILKN